MTTYVINKGAPVTTPRALMLSHTVHRMADLPPVPVAVVMLDVPRATDRHYRQVGERALRTLEALGVNTGNTDALAFARRFAHPAAHMTLNLTHTRDQETGTGPVRVDYTHNDGGGSLPGTTDVLSNTGDVYPLPAIDYTQAVN